MQERKHWAGVQMWAPEGRDQCWPNTWAGANLDEMKVWGPVTGGSCCGQERPGFAELTNTS